MERLTWISLARTITDLSKLQNIYVCSLGAFGSTIGLQKKMNISFFWSTIKMTVIQDIFLYTDILLLFFCPNSQTTRKFRFWCLRSSSRLPSRSSLMEHLCETRIESVSFTRLANITARLESFLQPKPLFYSKRRESDLLTGRDGLPSIVNDISNCSRPGKLGPSM